MKILLIDDQRLVRQGIGCLLNMIAEAEVVEAAGRGEALTLLRKHKPDVVVLSSSLKGAAASELLKRFLRERSAVRILVLGSHGEPIYASRVLAAGARGFVSRNASADEFISAVRKIAGGETYVDAETASTLATLKLKNEKSIVDQLSTRQIEVLRFEVSFPQKSRS
ncbi:MAG: response regulator transcription factor [Hyphomicrobium sp.]